MRSGRLPTPAVRRLSLYLRELEGFLERKLETVSSKQLGQALGYTDAQIRKDLACFGQFGHPGVGYRVPELIANIRRVLGTDRTWNALLVGVGNLGQALMAYRNFARKGFRLVAAFDNDPAKIGRPLAAIEGGTIERLGTADEMRATIQKLDAQLGVLCVPASDAQRVADILVDAGIQGLLNFAPVSLALPDDVALVGADLAIHFERLAFQVGAIHPRPSED